LVEASLAAARRSVASLRQPLERQAGLHQSLEKLAEEARRTTSAEVVLEVATQAPSLAPEVEENLLAIAHEALVNAVRHAAAGRIRLVLGNGDQRLRLAVEDDGLGFEPAQAGENGHYGLLGMRERAAAIGAEVAIDSHTGAGTRVEITLARPRLWSRR
ncbi:MAG TPA: ATP-binding protein, partial [Thermoanaerobaculia bacterium]|nr:ATP-binding protein [Thermoanaerobaculia bacterium]